jgi:hypothetical protein
MSTWRNDDVVRAGREPADAIDPVSGGRRHLRLGSAGGSVAAGAVGSGSEVFAGPGVSAGVSRSLVVDGVPCGTVVEPGETGSFPSRSEPIDVEPDGWWPVTPARGR